VKVVGGLAVWLDDGDAGEYWPAPGSCASVADLLRTCPGPEEKLAAGKLALKDVMEPSAPPNVLGAVDSPREVWA
jgi:hypothetical protein